MTEPVITVNGRTLSPDQARELRLLVDRQIFVTEGDDNRPPAIGPLSEVLALMDPPPTEHTAQLAGAPLGRQLTRQHDGEHVATAHEMPDGSIYAVVEREGADPAVDGPVVDFRIPREVLFLVVCVLSYASTRLQHGDAPARR